MSVLFSHICIKLKKNVGDYEYLDLVVGSLLEITGFSDKGLMFRKNCEWNHNVKHVPPITGNIDFVIFSEEEDGKEVYLMLVDENKNEEKSATITTQATIPITEEISRVACRLLQLALTNYHQLGATFPLAAISLINFTAKLFFVEFPIDYLRGLVEGNFDSGKTATIKSTQEFSVLVPESRAELVQYLQTIHEKLLLGFTEVKNNTSTGTGTGTGTTSENIQ